MDPERPESRGCPERVHPERVQSPDPQSFDRLAAEYDFVATLTRDHSYFLDRLPERRRHALDVGCGAGGLVEALSPHFEHVRGVDISEPLLELARERRGLANVEYAHGNAETLEGLVPPEADAGLFPGFDLIVTHTMLHHVKDSAAAVRHLAGMLSSGGHLLVVDNVSWTGAVPRIIILTAPWLDFVPNIRRHGFRDARRLLRFSVSKPWVDHLASDRYLTERGFRDRYGAVLPGAEMERRSVFMCAEWRAPRA